jgi:hypothetical protein
MKQKQIAEFSLADGTTFLVEVDEPESSAIERVALPFGQQVIKAKQSFDEVIDNVKPVAATLINQLRDLAADEVEVKFGLKLIVGTGQALAIFTSVGGEATYEITLKWQENKSRDKDDEQPN